MCTNRKVVIELNSKIFNKLKEATNMVADLESQFQKDKKCTEVKIYVNSLFPLERENRKRGGGDNPIRSNPKT